MKYIAITKEEAKQLYCRGEKVYISNNIRNHWQLPESWEYSSHAPEEQLFARSLPENEGETIFYKKS